MATPTTLPASFVAGSVLTATQMNDLRGAFRVLQVVRAGTNTQTINSTNTYADTTLTATITPKFASSSILVMIDQGGCGKLDGNAGSALYLRLLRGATDLGAFCGDMGFTNTNSYNYFGSVGFYLLDTPATTSATTYKTQLKNGVNASGVLVQATSSTSSIILMEISA